MDNVNVMTVEDVARANLDEIGTERRLPDAVVKAFRESGLNRLAIPTVLGGRQAPVTEMVDAVAAISAVDGSAGWCAAIGAGSNVFAGYLPEDVEATSVAHALAGAAAVHDGSGLLRALLDVHTARQHLLFSHQHRAAMAAALAGRDVTHPPFLM